MLPTISIQAGLTALKLGKLSDAIAIWENISHNQPAQSREALQAQMHLVQAYAQIGDRDRARTLCQQLINCTHAPVQIWAKQTLRNL